MTPKASASAANLLVIVVASKATSKTRRRAMVIPPRRFGVGEPSGSFWEATREGIRLPVPGNSRFPNGGRPAFVWRRPRSLKRKPPQYREVRATYADLPIATPPVGELPHPISGAPQCPTAPKLALTP